MLLSLGEVIADPKQRWGARLLPAAGKELRLFFFFFFFFFELERKIDTCGKYLLAGSSKHFPFSVPGELTDHPGGDKR